MTPSAAAALFSDNTDALALIVRCVSYPPSCVLLIATVLNLSSRICFCHVTSRPSRLARASLNVALTPYRTRATASFRTVKRWGVRSLLILPLSRLQLALAVTSMECAALLLVLLRCS